jgi:hypothetical protein
MKTYKRRTVLGMQRVCSSACEHDVKVTRIGDGWNIRVFLNGILNQESRVYSKEFISTEIQDMLRWEDKSGNISGMASAARDRPGLKQMSRSLS